ncbi:MAG TPA: phosphatidylserine/phosphatidylglycerophosphate/cardiolipin synthase family protein [Pantanalinema sp.]
MTQSFRSSENALPPRAPFRRAVLALCAASCLAGCFKLPAPRFEPPRRGGSDIRHLVEGECKLPTSCDNRVRIHVGGESTHQAMLAFIRAARRALYVEMFIFHDDPTGKEIADALVSRAKEGLDVRIRLDSLGVEGGRTDYRMFDYLRRGGVRVQTHNPWYWSLNGFNVTHRKLFVADQQRALTGGVNVGDEYRYHYYDAMLEIEGEAAGQIARVFKEAWGEDLAASASEPKAPVAPGAEPLQIALASPGTSQAHEIRDAYLTAALGASESLDAAFPYFWDEELVSAFAEAARRGVRVRILLPDWSRFDAFHLLNQSSARRLAASGAQVALVKEKFLHLKYLAADRLWASLGSANGDTRSLSENYELNVFFLRRQTVHAIDDLVYEPLWQGAHRVSLQAEFEPPAAKGWTLPLLEGIKGWF